MAVEIVFETHSLTEDNERGIATGWLGGRLSARGRSLAAELVELARDCDGDRVLLIGHAATRWALDHLLRGIPLEDSVTTPFGWREGWTYILPSGWRPGEP